MEASSKKIHRIYPVHRDGRFANFLGEKQEGMIRSAFMLMESLLQKTRGLRRLKQRWLATEPLDVHVYKRISNQPLVTWIGHATFLINIAGLNILTDPIFGNPSIFFRRMMPPGLGIEQLPHIDVILLSHNHLDHLHEATIAALKNRFPEVRILVPWGDKAWFDKRGYSNVMEYSWWENETVLFELTGSATTFTFLPAVHWSGRGIFDRNKSLWGSWMIQSLDHTLYFAGDTAYGRHFKAIAQEFPAIDTVLMPIGPCEPYEDTGLTHVNAEEAGQAFLDLGAHRFIPMHWGVFWFGTDYPLLPIERLQSWWKKNETQLTKAVLSPLKFGESVECMQQISESSISSTLLSSSLKL